jgi:hypothetical protein
MRFVKSTLGIDQVFESLLDFWNKIARDVLGHHIRHPVAGINRKEYPWAILLDLPPFQQVSTYSCGFVVGLSVLHYFSPKKSPTAFLERTGLTEENGMDHRSLVRALRGSGIAVDTKNNLNFTMIGKTIRRGHPVIVTVQRSTMDHWVVITGYQSRPNFVFLGNEDWKKSPKPVLWKDFVRVWAPRGCGLICRKGK